MSEHDTSWKIAPVDDLSRVSRGQRGMKRRVVLATLPAPHVTAPVVSFLERAADRGDCLFVLLDAAQLDKGVADLAAAVAGLHCVDGVCLMPAARWPQVVEALQPALIAKDALCSLIAIVGAENAEGWRTRVVSLGPAQESQRV